MNFSNLVKMSSAIYVYLFVYLFVYMFICFYLFDTFLRDLASGITSSCQFVASSLKTTSGLVVVGGKKIGKEHCTLSYRMCWQPTFQQHDFRGFDVNDKLEILIRAEAKYKNCFERRYVDF